MELVNEKEPKIKIVSARVPFRLAKKFAETCAKKSVTKQKAIIYLITAFTNSEGLNDDGRNKRPEN